KFYDAGIKISINSDDPPFMSTTLAKEYHQVQESYNFDDKKMNQITTMAIEAAFVDEKTKDELLAKI
ncbi:MAG: adenosine deaminase, partial [bacterium]|nr:adenosine deaminase [bacterium]